VRENELREPVAMIVRKYGGNRGGMARSDKWEKQWHGKYA
jgi:hypothetical protein